MTDNLMAWLGPAADDLSPEQIERIADASADIDRRYPEPDDEDKRQAALSATVQYLLGDTDAATVHRELTEARRREREAYASSLQVAVMLVRDGGEKKGSAQAVGIDRMGLLKALGER